MENRRGGTQAGAESEFVDDDKGGVKTEGTYRLCQKSPIGIDGGLGQEVVSTCEQTGPLLQGE